MSQPAKWHATVSYTNTSGREQISDEIADAITRLPGYGQVTFDGRHVTLSMTVQASTLRRATDEALKAAQAAYAEAFDVVGTPVRVEVLPEDEHLRQLAHPEPEPLVSTPEIAEMLSRDGKPISRQRVHQLSVDDPDFPAPVADLKVGKVWTRASVEEYGKRWPRKVGRPAKAA